MGNEDFRKAYSEFESVVRHRQDRSTGAFLINENILLLLRLLSSDIQADNCLIPNVGMFGELALCAGKADIYSVSYDVDEILEKSGYTENISLIHADFLDVDIVGKYSSIILFPPLGVRTEDSRSEILYVEKCLRLLAENGRAVILLPQNILTAPAFHEMREKILNDYCLAAVFTLDRVSRGTGVQCSVIVVDNKAQNEKIFMSLKNENTEEVFSGYKNGTRGFYVPASEVYDRFDANYYDPQYKVVRDLIQRRDTVKLGDIADITSGCLIPSEERKSYGDYLIIKPQYICNGKIEIQKEQKVFCSSEFVASTRRAERCILKNGDVIISTMGNTNWAVYRGEEDYAIANQHVAILRGKQEYEEWLRLFFNTRIGVEALETQLKFINHGSVFNHISVRGLGDMYVPDIKMMKNAERFNKATDLEARVASLFRDLGWTVKEAYGEGRVRYDIALLDNEVLQGVVEVKSYKSDQIERNSILARQLASMKRELGDVSLYLFVDNDIYEYVDGTLEQLPELPRPGKKITIKKIESKDEKIGKNSITIEKNSIGESSIADKFTMEMILRGIGEIKASAHRIESKVDNIAEKIEMLSKQISGYQSLVDKQLELAVTADEEERIIHAFSEECAERIVGEVDARNSEKEFNTELNKLIISFGEDAWNKMEESSKTFLVSSKVIFNNLVGLQDIVDYSGVCLLVTKALEVEMGKRFCKNYISFLKSKYPGKANFPLFPTPLLDKYGKPIKPKHFTLGSVAYVLCYLKTDGLTEEQENNNRYKLIEYSKEKLLSGKTDDEIMELLQNYAESVEEVKNDYRNPSAHTNELRRVDAEQCFALVVDVEKLMKKMLDSFDE